MEAKMTRAYDETDFHAADTAFFVGQSSNGGERRFWPLIRSEKLRRQRFSGHSIARPSFRALLSKSSNYELDVLPRTSSTRRRN